MRSISTKTGDSGQTSLADGQRVAKDSLVIEVIGALDELNSWLGLVVAKLSPTFEEENEFFQHLQQSLYQISAQLAQAPGSELKQQTLVKLEKHSQDLQKSMADGWHQNFLYPGGTELGGYLDVARTVCRRLECLAFKLNRQQTVSQVILKYLNRLSDYLYVLRCRINLYQKHSEKELSSDE